MVLNLYVMQVQKQNSIFFFVLSYFIHKTGCNDMSFSHTVMWFSIRDVYRYQPISHSSCTFSTMHGSLMSGGT